jgi:hypothetical protein
MTERGLGTRGLPFPPQSGRARPTAEGSKAAPALRPSGAPCSTAAGLPRRHHLLATTPQPLNLLGVLRQPGASANSTSARTAPLAPAVAQAAVPAQAGVPVRALLCSRARYGSRAAAWPQARVPVRARLAGRRLNHRPRQAPLSAPDHRGHGFRRRPAASPRRRGAPSGQSDGWPDVPHRWWDRRSQARRLGPVPLPGCPRSFPSGPRRALRKARTRRVAMSSRWRGELVLAQNRARTAHRARAERNRHCRSVRLADQPAWRPVCFRRPTVLPSSALRWVARRQRAPGPAARPWLARQRAAQP